MVPNFAALLGRYSAAYFVNGSEIGIEINNKFIVLVVWHRNPVVRALALQIEDTEFKTRIFKIFIFCIHF